MATGGGDTDEGDRSCGTDGAKPQPSGLSAPLSAPRFAPGCEESAFPELTGLRVALGWTRRDLAVVMAPFFPQQNVLAVVDRIRRVEQLGQSPDAAFVEAIAAAFEISRDAARSLFNLPLD